jgi:metal-dependent hydrolase (beta-lactamase superfamily II)
MDNMRELTIKIIYDNSKENPNLQEGWGFSAYIDIGSRKILFDTGNDQKDQQICFPIFLTDV